ANQNSRFSSENSRQRNARNNAEPSVLKFFCSQNRKESRIKSKKYLHRLAIRSRNDFDHFSTSSRDGLTVDACNDESNYKNEENEKFILNLIMKIYSCYSLNSVENLKSIVGLSTKRKK
ncbi:hypothetical protein DERP_011049, partial [Dermatophagoides pteronyssinus]